MSFPLAKRQIASGYLPLSEARTAMPWHGFVWEEGSGQGGLRMDRTDCRGQFAIRSVARKGNLAAGQCRQEVSLLLKGFFIVIVLNNVYCPHQLGGQLEVDNRINLQASNMRARKVLLRLGEELVEETCVRATKDVPNYT